MTIQYLIWSNEHGGWWRPREFGYTLDITEAGRYPLKRAEEIVTNAGAYGPHAGVPNEVLMLAPEHRWQGGPPEPELDVEGDPYRQYIEKSYPDDADAVMAGETTTSRHYDGPCMDPQCNDSTWDHPCPVPPMGWREVTTDDR